MSRSSSCRVSRPNEKKKKKNVPIYSPQGLQTGLFLLQYGFSTPEVPELSSHRRPVVMFRRSGGLALTG